MALDPSIALGYRPPQINLDVPSPIHQFGQLLTLRQMMDASQQRELERQQTQQAIQEGAIKLQMAQQAQQDDTIGRQALVDSGGDTDKYRTLIIQRGISPQGLFNFEKIQRQALLDRATYDEKTFKTKEYQDSKLAAVADTMQQDRPDEYFSKWPQYAQTINEIRPGSVSPDQPVPYNQLGTWALHFNTEDSLNKKAKNLRETAESAATIAQKQAEAEKNQLAAVQARRLNLVPAAMTAFRTGPEEWQAFLAGLPAEDRPAFASAKSADEIWKGLLTPEQRQKAEQEAATAAETAKQHGIQNAFEKIRVGIEATRNKREQDIYQQTYGEGANPALVAVEPKLRVPATKEAQKAGDEYLKTNEVADQMQSMIDMARAGNKAAGSGLPLVGVETLNAINGIKRINRDEIAQYQGAGSLLDQIQGKIGKLAVGQPIPADVLTDVEKMHNILRQNADTSYKAKLGSINQNYRSNFQPVKAPQRPAQAAAAPPMPQTLTAADKGKTYTNRNGQKIKITDVNPQNGTQFRYEVVQ